MSASEPESCLQIYGERRMAITIAASAAVSIEDANRDIMSYKGNQAAVKQPFGYDINGPTGQKEVIHEKIRRDSGGFCDLLSPG